MCGAGLCSSSLVEPEERALAGQEVAPVRDLESQKRGAPLERGLLYGWFPQSQKLLHAMVTNLTSTAKFGRLSRLRTCSKSSEQQSHQYQVDELQAGVQ